MKIIIAGGCLYGYAGDIQVIKNISRNISCDNEIYLFPILPLIQKSDDYHQLKVIKKIISQQIIKNSIFNSINWFRTVFKYIKKDSFRNISYYLITLFNKIMLEKAIQEINPDVIHVHGLAIDQLPLIEAAITFNIPLVVTVHGMLKDYDKLYFHRETEKYCLDQTLNYENSLLTTVSSSIKNYLIKNYEIKPSKVKVIPNGVNNQRFYYKPLKNYLRELYDLPQDKKIIIQVGTLNQIKNHIFVLKTINKMDPPLKKEFLYLIIGDGPEKNHLKKYCDDHDLNDQVKFTGSIRNKELVDWYNMADLLLAPSLSEGFSIVFLESLACGLPIITFQDLSVASEIHDSEYMYLIKERDKNALIQGIIKCLDKKWDREKITSFISQYDWSIISREYLELYKELRK